MGNALILEFFDELPERCPEDNPLEWRIRYKAARERFRKQVAQRYLESTVLRLLVTTDDVRTRKAAILALGMLGTMEQSNRPLSDWLHDDDFEVRQQTVESLWHLWFRGAGEAAHQELQKALRRRGPGEAVAYLTRLIEKLPTFAEAYNQRAILHFHSQDWVRSIADYEKAIALNPQHFGALSGMGQSLLQLRRGRAALRAFQQALKIHPGLEGIAETVRTLEKQLSDDKK